MKLFPFRAMLFPNRKTNPSWKPAALVIDKDADTHRSIHVMIGKEYDVHHAYFPRLALSLLEKRRFNVVFTSLDMGSADETLNIHRTIESISKDKGIPMIALGERRSAPEDKESLGKPFDVDRLLAAVRSAVGTPPDRSGEKRG